jgi:hypothetical protein
VTGIVRLLFRDKSGTSTGGRQCKIRTMTEWQNPQNNSGVVGPTEGSDLAELGEHVAVGHHDLTTPVSTLHGGQDEWVR